MKVFNFFSHIFAVFSFLTLGSLLILVACHMLSLEDALLQLRGVYASPWHSLQTGFFGLVCITVGLSFARMMVKQRRNTEALIFQSEIGPMVVSTTTLEDVVRKVLKHFHLVKDCKTKILISGKDVEIRLRLVLWSAVRVQELLTEIQSEIDARARKLLGPENHLEIICDVQGIEDHEPETLKIDKGEAVSL